MKWLKEFVQRALASRGYAVMKLYPPDITPEFLALHERVKPFTMTSIERQLALYQAVRYVMDARIEGDIVECGVWRGGSSMLTALTLLEEGVSDRTLYLYDTFAGMPEPTEHDVNISGNAASRKWHALLRGAVNEWDYAPIEEVRRNMDSTGYPRERVVLVKGKVEQTLPATMPDRIALLRLDTDWYASTKHELTHLFPKLVPGGILIIDDYGHWSGAREAVDEYFAARGERPLLVRVDYTGRVAVKR